jgi:hypothetical protein
MSDHERGAYAPPTDAPLSFDARQPVQGARPFPFTLIISVLVLIGLAGAIFVFYRSGVRQAGQPPQTVGVPVTAMKAPPPAEAQPQDPAAGLQIYKAEGGRSVPGQPQFTLPPEQPQPRPQPQTPAVVIASAPPPSPPISASALRPALPAPPPAATPPAPAPIAKSAPIPVEPPAAAKARSPTPNAAVVKAEPAPAPSSKAAGVAAVQIGAFSSQALADKGWNDAAALAPGAAAGKGKSVEKVEKDGKTLFRTQVTGFASRADAAAFCGKLKAAGKACFVK